MNAVQNDPRHSRMFLKSRVAKLPVQKVASFAKMHSGALSFCRANTWFVALSAAMEHDDYRNAPYAGQRLSGVLKSLFNIWLAVYEICGTIEEVMRMIALWHSAVGYTEIE